MTRNQRMTDTVAASDAARVLGDLTGISVSTDERWPSGPGADGEYGTLRISTLRQQNEQSERRTSQLRRSSAIFSHPS